MCAFPARNTARNRITAGFDDPVMGAQQTFRALLTAMARPGTLCQTPAALRTPAGLCDAAAAVCLTLFDFDTPVWTDLPNQDPILDWLRFHCGAPLVSDPRKGRFALVTCAESLPDLDRFDAGSDDHPDQSATLIVQAGGISAQKGVALTGPGIGPRPAQAEADAVAHLRVKGLPRRFWEQRAKTMPAFPRGVDIVFVSGCCLAALPRTTAVMSS